MLKQPLHENFTPSLFWDVDPATLDSAKHRRWVVQRVLEYGTLQDWRALCELYTLQGVVHAAQQARTLEPKALAFLCVISDTPKDSFRCCTTKHYTRRHWAY